MAEDGIFLDIFARLNMASFAAAIAEVKALASKAGGDISKGMFNTRDFDRQMAEYNRSMRTWVTEMDAYKTQMADFSKVEASYRDLGRTVEASYAKMVRDAEVAQRDLARVNSLIAAGVDAQSTKMAAAYTMADASAAVAGRSRRDYQAVNSRYRDEEPSRPVEPESPRPPERESRIIPAIGRGGNLLGAGSAIAGAGILVEGGRIASSVQDSLNNLAVLQQESQANIAKITQAVYDQASQTGYGARDVAKLYAAAEGSTNNITGKQYRGQEAIDIVGNALRLSRVSGGRLSPEESLQGLTTTMHDYRVGPEGSEGVAGMLMAAIAQQKGNPEELFRSLHTIEPSAMLAQIRPEEIFAALAQTSQTGASNQQSAVNISNIIKSFARPNATTVRALGQLNLDPEDMSVELSKKGLAGTLGEVLQAISNDKFGPNGSVVLGALTKNALLGKQQKDAYGEMSPQAQALVDSEAFRKSLVGNFNIRKIMQKHSGDFTEHDEPFVELWLKQQKALEGPSAVLKRGGLTTESALGAFGEAFNTKDAANAAMILAGSPEALQQYRDREEDMKKKGSPGAFEDAFNKAMEPNAEKWKQLGATAGALAGRLAEDLLPVLTDVANKFKGVLDFLGRHEAVANALLDAMGGAAAAWALHKTHLDTLLFKGVKALGGLAGNMDIVRSGGPIGGAPSYGGAASSEEGGAALNRGVVTGAEEGGPILGRGVVVGAEEAAGLLTRAEVKGGEEAAPALTRGVASGGEEAGRAIATQMEVAGRVAGGEMATAVEGRMAGMGGMLAAAAGPALAGIIGSQIVDDAARKFDQTHGGHGAQDFTNNPLLQFGPWLLNQGHNFIDNKPVIANIPGVGDVTLVPSFGNPPKNPPGHSMGGMVGYKRGGKTADPYSQPLLGERDMGGDSILGMLGGMPVGLRGGEGILTPEAVAKVGGKEGIDALNNPWSNPLKVGTSFYSAFAKGFAKTSKWGKYLEASSQSLTDLEQAFDRGDKEHKAGRPRKYGDMTEAQLGMYLSGLPPEQLASMGVKVGKRGGLTLPDGTHVPTGHSSGGSDSVGRGASYSSKNEEQVHRIFSQFFPESEWQSYRNLEMHEAGFDPLAHNPSGAHGIGQFMPYTWGQYGTGPKTDNLLSQAIDQMKYIRGRYGSPSAAWGQYFNHPGGEGSYARGGIVGYGAGGEVPLSPFNPFEPGPPSPGGPKPGDHQVVTVPQPPRQYHVAQPGQTYPAPNGLMPPNITDLARQPGGPAPMDQPPPPTPGAQPAGPRVGASIGQFTPPGTNPGTYGFSNPDRNILGSPSRQGGTENESKGFGIGGGVLGMAEQAASMAADAFAPGSGQGAQMAFKLAERAISWGGQMAGAALSGVIETFLPNNSPLADPTNNLFGKIALGIVGAHPSPKNMAGESAMQLKPQEGQGGEGSKSVGGIPMIHLDHPTIHNHGQQDWGGMQNAISQASFGLDVHR